MILKTKRRAFIGAGNFLTRTPLPSAPFRKKHHRWLPQAFIIIYYYKILFKSIILYIFYEIFIVMEPLLRHSRKRKPSQRFPTGRLLIKKTRVPTPPEPSPFDSQSLFFRDALEQPALLDDVLDKRRERLRLIGLPRGHIRDHARIEVHARPRRPAWISCAAASGTPGSAGRC